MGFGSVKETCVVNEIIDRTAHNCYYHCNDRANKCNLVRDEYPCAPKTCKWHRTKEELIESLYKASKNYERATGKDDYVVRFCPMVLRAELIEIRAKRKREEYGRE